MTTKAKTRIAALGLTVLSVAGIAVASGASAASASVASPTAAAAPSSAKAPVPARSQPHGSQQLFGRDRGAVSL